jgi:hypothetical protein
MATLVARKAEASTRLKVATDPPSAIRGAAEIEDWLQRFELELARLIELLERVEYFASSGWASGDVETIIHARIACESLVVGLAQISPVVVIAAADLYMGEMLDTGIPGELQGPPESPAGPVRGHGLSAMLETWRILRQRSTAEFLTQGEEAAIVLDAAAILAAVQAVAIQIMRELLASEGRATDASHG